MVILSLISCSSKSKASFVNVFNNLSFALLASGIPSDSMCLLDSESMSGLTFV